MALRGLGFCNIVQTPVNAVVGYVQHQRLKIIHCAGKSRLRGRIRLKLLKQLPQFVPLVCRKQAENPFGRLRFPLLLGRFAGLVVGIGISCINFYDVVDQCHHHRPSHIKRLVGIFPQQPHHHGHMPRMFRIIFLPSHVCQVSLAQNILLFVCFQQKAKLLCKAFLFHTIPPVALRFLPLL